MYREQGGRIFPASVTYDIVFLIDVSASSYAASISDLDYTEEALLDSPYPETARLIGFAYILPTILDYFV